jgi:hypothetical protein
MPTESGLAMVRLGESVTIALVSLSVASLCTVGGLYATSELHDIAREALWGLSAGIGTRAASQSRHLKNCTVELKPDDLRRRHRTSACHFIRAISWAAASGPRAGCSSTKMCVRNF